MKAEQLPWAETSSWFTRPFEDYVGYVAQRCDKTTVDAMMRVAWETVGARSRGTATAICSTGLTHIGITVVVDHTRGHVIWVKPGKNADTLKAFFDELGPGTAVRDGRVTRGVFGA